jgi:hypothetical protein
MSVESNPPLTSGLFAVLAQSTSPLKLAVYV